MRPTVVLLTDFGRGPYPGIVKGVISRYCPDALVIDLTHDVTPHDVREGAWILYTSHRYFPEDSVFLAVVDPGVGTERAAVAVKTTHHFFVGPDNGILFPAATDDGVKEVVRLPVPPDASRTFHARDVFAPAAAKLASGVPFDSLGARADLTVELKFALDLDGRKGEVVTIDSFGNIITNLPPVPGSPVTPVPSGTAQPQEGGSPSDQFGRREYRVTVEREGKLTFEGTLPGFTTYAEAGPGAPFVITGSAGTLELSVKGGRAADLIDVYIGDAITIC